MKIIIDPGHGGEDAGAAYGGVREADIALGIACLVWYELQVRGYDARLSRQQDMFVSLDDRVRMTNEWPAAPKSFPGISRSGFLHNL